MLLVDFDVPINYYFHLKITRTLNISYHIHRNHVQHALRAANLNIKNYFFRKFYDKRPPKCKIDCRNRDGKAN